MTLKMKICLIRSTAVQAAVEQSGDNTALPRLSKDKEMSKVKKPWMTFWNCLQSLMNVDWHMWFRDLTKILFTSIHRRHRADKLPTIFRLIWLRISRKKRKCLESIYHQELSKLFVLIIKWTRKPCCRRETARCRCKFWSIPSPLALCWSNIFSQSNAVSQWMYRVCVNTVCLKKQKNMYY